MEVSLPSSLDFSKALPELPNGTTATLMSVQSTNGISFSTGQTIQFDLPSRSGLFIDGKSVFLRFKLTVPAGATASGVRRKPAYSPFSRLDEFVGSVPVNSIYQYNQVANALVDLRYGVADVFAQQYAFGLTDSPAAGWADVDGQAIAATGTGYFYCAAPLIGSFMQECDKLIPTGLMAPIRVQLTIDSLNNILSDTTSASLTLTNPELCFAALDFGPQVESMITSMAPKIYLKSGGVANASQNLGTAVSGFMTLPFNHRYESIKNLYFLTTTTNAKAVNGIMDSWNVLSSAAGSNSGAGGTFQVQIGQAVYPQLPINSATGGLGAIQQYNRECVGMISDCRLSQCTIASAFNQYASNNTASSLSMVAGDANNPGPAKHIIGVPLSRINQPNPYSTLALMSGVSAASTPINVLLNIGTTTQAGILYSASLIAEYDMLIEIDVMTKQVRVIC